MSKESDTTEVTRHACTEAHGSKIMPKQIQNQLNKTRYNSIINRTVG